MEPPPFATSWDADLVAGPITVPAVEPGPPQWRVRDFILAAAGGFAGVLVVGGVALGLGASDQDLIVVGSLGQFAGHLVAIGLLARSRGGLRSFGFEVEPSDVVYIFYGIGLQIVLPLLFAPLAQLVGDGQSGQVVAEQLQQLRETPNRVLMAGIIAVLAPISEEIMFRGILLKATSHRGVWQMSLITASVFAAFHLFGLTGDILSSLVLLLPTFLIMGLLLARLTLRHGRLGPAIFVHSGFNLLALSVLLIPPELLESATGAIRLP